MSRVESMFYSVATAAGIYLFLTVGLGLFQPTSDAQAQLPPASAGVHQGCGMAGGGGCGCGH